MTRFGADGFVECSLLEDNNKAQNGKKEMKILGPKLEREYLRQKWN
jgi:hypothetical protein